MLHLAAAVLHDARRLFGAGSHGVAAHCEADARRLPAQGQQVRGEIEQRSVFGNPGVDGGVVKKTEFIKHPIGVTRQRPAGYELSDYDDETVDVWEENWPSAMFFSRLGTQWRYAGMGSPCGLDYTAVLALLRTLRLPRAEQDAQFDDVQTMERAALQEMAGQAKG